MLDDRKKKVLQAIVEEYINTAEPVSSNALTNNYGLNYSSATIRNEMADLEKKGYLDKTHTSSGRIPSEKGYRYYVDELMKDDDISLEEIKYISSKLETKVNEIEELLVRYYDGETNEAEEKELKEFFAQADVPAHLLAEKRLFMQLASQPEPETPEGLESKLSGLIDEWDTHERRTTKIKKHTRIIHLQWVGSIAASLLILFSVGMYLYKPYTPPTPQDTCSSPTEAYAEAQKALFMFSSALNKGVQQMETVHETTEKVQKNVNQQLKRFKNLRQ